MPDQPENDQFYWTPLVHNVFGQTAVVAKEDWVHNILTVEIPITTDDSNEILLDDKLYETIKSAFGSSQVGFSAGENEDGDKVLILRIIKANFPQRPHSWTK